MRLSTVGLLVLALAAVGGCTATEPEQVGQSPSLPPVTGDVSPGGEPTATCSVGSVALGPPANGERAFTDVMVLTTSPSTVAVGDLVNEPKHARIAWRSAPAPWTGSVLAAIAKLDEPPELDVWSSSAEVSQLLDGVHEPDPKMLGYASVLEQRRDVTVQCVGGGEARGVLTMYTDNEIGVVSCSTAPKTQSQEPSAIAFEQFCEQP